jgi:periplasmic protein TonB
MHSNQRQGLSVSLLASVAFHALLALGLYWAGQLAHEREREPEPIEVEIVQPVPPPPPLVEPPPPEPEPEPLPEPEPPPKKVAVQNPPTPREPPPRAPPPAEPPPEAQPAPGPSTDDTAPAPVVTLPDIAPGGTGPAVAVGARSTRKVGTGGTGTNTGGGGAPESQGTAGPQPLSIAAIKRRAQPINPDLDTSKLYPPEARRLSIEGQVKVALVVDATGKVTSRHLITRLGHGLDELALELARRLRFEPAIDTNDRPVADKVVWTFTFVLPR